MKLIIAGSRTIDWWDTFDINEVCKSLPEYPTEIVCGMAKGIDMLGAHFGYEYNIPVKEFPANWDKFGKGAGYIRNAEMAEYADMLLAIWDGKSRGTKNMIQEMLDRDKPVQVLLA